MKKLLLILLVFCLLSGCVKHSMTNEPTTQEGTTSTAAEIITTTEELVSTTSHYDYIGYKFIVLPEIIELQSLYFDTFNVTDMNKIYAYLRFFEENRERFEGFVEYLNGSDSQHGAHGPGVDFNEDWEYLKNITYTKGNGYHFVDEFHDYYRVGDFLDHVNFHSSNSMDIYPPDVHRYTYTHDNRLLEYSIWVDYEFSYDNVGVTYSDAYLCVVDLGDGWYFSAYYGIEGVDC